MKRILQIIGGLLLLAVGYLTFWPVPFEPLPFKAPPNPGLTGAFAKNDILYNAHKILEGVGVGPEDIAMSPDSQYLYTGYEDGRIIRFPRDARTWKVFAETGGRPLGMGFDAAGNLIVADAEKGILSIDSTGKVTVLTNSVNGAPIGFADDLDIASDGTIYFSDATQRTDGDLIYEAWEMRPSGRLLSYDPRTQTTRVELDSLRFANGVTMGPDDEYLLFNETFGMVVNKYWLKGPKKGQKEIFVSELPGFPDNINYNDAGIFWLAIPTLRPAKEIEDLYDKPFLRKVILRLPDKVLRGVEPKPFGMVLGLDLEGNVKYNYQDTLGVFHDITSATQFGDVLWLGSLKTDFAGAFIFK
ncbi:MAG: SMP-30/gluconolactonase/LRE family protein [Bacteroidetes bacterium]|nr:MAG: SMP-30/gluconolactonase/LRE family protein [Bacteroidota bacterium]